MQQEVERILFDLDPLHVNLKGITIHILDSVLYLDGNIFSQLRADIVEEQVLGVPGLLEIKNNLIGDDRLAADLVMALRDTTPLLMKAWCRQTALKLIRVGEC